MERNDNNTETVSDETFDDITFAFMDEWEAGEETGIRPTLGDYLKRHPRYAAELTDFVLGYIRLQRSSEVSYEEPLFPEAVRAGERVRETLGLPKYVTSDPPAVPFALLMKNAGASVVKLRNALGVPAMLINRMQNGLISDWSGALVRRVADAMGCTADDVATALQASFNTGANLAATHFKATGGDPDAKAVQGTPKTLAETLDELGFSAADKARWLADE